MDVRLEQKFEALKENIKGMGCVAVAFSAGVDSTLLLAAAAEALGERAVAVSVEADWVPRREQHEAQDFCSSRTIRRIRLNVRAEDIPGFAENPPERCYLCKRVLFTKILEAARANGIDCVLEGSNTDDLSDYRPGLRAIAELGIKSPLREAGLCKEQIRALSRMLGLPTADKPSFACLASRIPYGETITADKLYMAEQGEQLLLDEGFLQFRVRVHGTLARIEVLPEEMERLLKEPLREKIYEKLRRLGFSYVALDLKGYRTGSMNEAL